MHGGRRRGNDERKKKTTKRVKPARICFSVNLSFTIKDIAQCRIQVYPGTHQFLLLPLAAARTDGPVFLPRKPRRRELPPNDQMTERGVWTPAPASHLLFGVLPPRRLVLIFRTILVSIEKVTPLLLIVKKLPAITTGKRFTKPAWHLSGKS